MSNEPRKLGELFIEIVRACQASGKAGVIIAVKCGDDDPLAPGGSMITTWGDTSSLPHRIKQHLKGQ